MKSLLLTPLLAVCLACTGLPPGALSALEAGRGAAARPSVPQLVNQGQALAQAAEAGTAPELNTSGEVQQLRAAPATSCPGRAGARPGRAAVRPMSGASAGADHTPLYFGSLPPPA